MLSLRQHFQRIKQIVDWSWTLAILCMVGYITLGQLVQLYWAMVCLGGLAASFGLFYEFSCQKLVELNAIDDIYMLQKAFTTSALAQDLLRKFAHKNSEIINQFPEFVYIRNQVSNIRETSEARIQQKVNRQTQPPPKSSSQPQVQKPVQPTTPSPKPPRQPQPPLKNLSQPQVQKTAQPTNPYTQSPRQPQPSLRRETRPKITPEEHRRILNKSDYVPVKGHYRNGHWVRPHFRRKSRR